DSETETIKAKEEIPAVDVQVVVHGSSGQGDGSQTTSSLGTEKTLLLSDHPTKNHLHENCLNVTQLLWNFGLDRASHITPDHFTFLCPALLYQIDSGVCLRHTNPHTHEDRNSVAFLRGDRSLHGDDHVSYDNITLKDSHVERILISKKDI
ncbi:zinc transporter ZIP5, partial [Tachysurus ichikawai]